MKHWIICEYSFTLLFVVLVKGETKNRIKLNNINLKIELSLSEWNKDFQVQ